MKILVTGAAGFIGTQVVRKLLENGCQVRALTRSEEQASLQSWNKHPNVELSFSGFSDQDACQQLTEGVDIIIHLAATHANSWTEQKQRTVKDTKTIVQAAIENKIQRFVLASSFAVYDYSRPSEATEINEQASLIAETDERGPYAWAKLQQEKIVRQAGIGAGLPFVILRLGTVYGPNAVWTHRLGIKKGMVWIRLGSKARIPLTFVSNAADALAQAACEPKCIDEIINVVDDDCPTQKSYMSELRTLYKKHVIIIPINFGAFRLMSLILWSLACLVKAEKKIPLTLRPMCIDAMAKPMNFSNFHIKKVLGWKPRISRTDALKLVFGDRI